VFGYASIAVGLIVLIAGFAGNVIFEHYPEVAERYGRRFTRDATLFSIRILGAIIILFGSIVEIIASRLGAR
jgi:hypothetical protein